MLVRTANQTDCDGWSRMRCALWPESVEDTQHSEIEAWLGDPERRGAFVAEGDGGRLIGFAEVSLREYLADGGAVGLMCYLEGWYVDPEYRRRGVGRQLVEPVEQWGRQRGCCKMPSDCALDNSISQQAHQALGFCETYRAVNFSKDL